MTGTMKVIIGLIVVLVVAGIGFMVVPRLHQRSPVAATSEKKVIYHCPMHPAYLSDKPGDCPICGMKLVPVKSGAESPTAPASSGPSGAPDRKIIYYFDPMNPSHTYDKPGKAPDGMDLVPAYGDDGTAVRGAISIDPTTVQNMGVTTETVARRALTKRIRASAVLDLNETSVSIVNTKIMGWVERLSIDYTGQQVRRGQPLLTIYSPDLISTQEEYLQALRYAATLPAGAGDEVKTSAMELAASGKRRLLNWDIPASDIAALERRGTPDRTMTIYAPASGVVLEKMVVAGQKIEPGMALYRIADLTTVWAMANVYQEDIPYVKVGMEAVIAMPSAAGKTYSGKVQFISPVLDPATKTAAIRIAIANTADYSLKPQMFANVEFLSPTSGRILSVSQQAVLHTGTRTLVIISLGDGYYKPQDVELGVSAGDYVEIRKGLIEGQTIVTSSQFLIDAESNLKEAVGQMSGMEMPGDKGQSGALPEKGPVSKDRMNLPGMNMKEDTALQSAGVSHSAKMQAVPVKVVYTCPMDPQVKNDNPGKCPICGMNLVPTTASGAAKWPGSSHK